MVPQWAHGGKNPLGLVAFAPVGALSEWWCPSHLYPNARGCSLLLLPRDASTTDNNILHSRVTPASRPAEQHSLQPPCAMTDAGASPATAPVAAPSPAASAHGQPTPGPAGPRQMQSPMVLDDDKKRELIANMDQARVNALRKVCHHRQSSWMQCIFRLHAPARPGALAGRPYKGELDGACPRARHPPDAPPRRPDRGDEEKAPG